MPTWKLPAAVVVMRRLVLSQKTRAPVVVASAGSLVMSNTPWVAASMIAFCAPSTAATPKSAPTRTPWPERMPPA